MVMRILITFMLIVLAGGFVFFAGSVIWLGMREFFRLYGQKKRKPAAKPAAKPVYTPPPPSLP